MRSLRTYLSCLLAIATCQIGYAIDPHRSISQYVSQRWSAEDGFPKGPVYSIRQTLDGYLWIGTERGLFRFDGLRFTQMKSDDPELPALSHVLGLTVDSTGMLWTQLRRPSLLRKRDGPFENGMIALPGVNGAIGAMGRTHDGALLLWVLQGEGSVILVRSGKFETIATPKDFTRSPVLAITQTADGYVWAGTRDAGLFRLRGTETIPVKDGLPDPKVNTIAAGKNGQLWIGTDSGVVRWDGARLTNQGVAKELNGVQALSLLVDLDSNLWVGTNSQGLFRVNDHGVAALIDPNRESSDAVTALFEDREGSIWVGSSSGLNRLRDSAFVTYSLSEGIPSEGSTPIYAEADGRLWFAPVDGGLWWLKDGKHGRVSVDGLDLDIVYSIAGGKGGIWVGRQNGGLTFLSTGTGPMIAKSYRKRDGLAQDSVFSVYQARDGAIWAGTLSGGLSRLLDGRIRNYTTADGLASNTVNSILESSHGTVWVASPAGLSALVHGRWEKQGLPSVEVNCLLEDRSGTLWVGTSAGLAYERGGSFHKPARGPAALREPIYGMAEDSSGSIWLTSASHVLRVRKAKILGGGLNDSDVREYGLADGLRGMEGVKRHSSVVSDSLGRIWFSLNHGISVIDPALMRSNSAPAIAHLQSVSADGRPISLKDSMQVAGGFRRLAFGYTGLCLSAPELVQFRYRLDGFDKDWSEPVSTREAVYTNLGPGDYRFRVVSSNPDGVWSPEEAAIAFHVEPLIWQTLWFQAGVFGAAVMMVLGLYRYRLHHVTGQMNLRFEERLSERNRIAQELHDTLLQGFLSASMQVHVAADLTADDSKAKPTLTRAMQLMKQVIEEGRNAVRGLRSTQSASLDLEQAFSRVPQELGGLVGSQQPSFRVVVEGQSRPLHPLLRDEVYRVGREAVVNAYRHARASTIEIELVYSSKELRIRVSDDGGGIDPQIVASGKDGHWGLSGMRERAERIHARLHVRSSATAGTEVELIVPSHVAFEDHAAHPLSWIGIRWRK